jgi:FtsP/CotA-like multicopper oxidase with cupredoxin domain
VRLPGDWRATSRRQLCSTFAKAISLAGLGLLRADNRPGRLREYWLQADSFFHNVVPKGLDRMTGEDYTSGHSSYWAIGYRAYTPEWGSLLGESPSLGANSGIPGPIVRAEVGDTIRIHFRNNDTHYKFPHSIHTHGLKYTPENDGAWIWGQMNTPGTAIQFGEQYTYEYTASPTSVGSWPYHDHSIPETARPGRMPAMEMGAELGLFGMIVITDRKTPRVDRECVLVMHDLYKDDIPSLAKDFDCFNGLSFLGNTPMFTVRAGERVRWRIMSLGKEMHAFHLHGHTWQTDGRYEDTVVMGPATTATFDYVEDRPGEWLYHCHMPDHMMGGMVGTYKVTE